MVQSPIITLDIVFLTTSFVFLFGLCVGSFLNVCAWRLPRQESIVNPGSHCPKCGHELRAWELFPILSWLILRARCSSCGERISIRYPAVEFLTGIVFTLIWLKIVFEAWPLEIAPGYLFLGAAIIVVAITDLEHLVIPNEITLTGIIIALLLAALLPGSHFAAQFLDASSFHDPLLLGWAYQILSFWLPDLMVSPHVVSLLDAIGGLLLGGGVLLLLLELGKVLWGRRQYSLEEPGQMILDATGVRVEDVYEAAWDEMFFRASDKFRADISAATVQLKNEPAKAVGEQLLRADEDGICVDDIRYEWNEVERVQATVKKWQSPREVMGYGDVKLMAMIGAFLGADAVLFVIMISATLGTVVGVASILTGLHKRHVPLPFGPFISAAALFWMLAGETFLNWYSTILTGVLR